MGWDDGIDFEGPDGVVRTKMCLLGHRFEVSWRKRKAVGLRRKGIDLRAAIRLLDDPRAILEFQADGPYIGQYRAVGRPPDDGRVLTVAIELTYPDDDIRDEDVGLIRIFTAWDSSRAERDLYDRKGR